MKGKFTRVPNLLIDACIPSIVGLGAFTTYLAILRFAWTDPTKGDAFVRDLGHAGLIVSRVTNRKLSTIVGCSRKATVSAHTRKLRECGLLEVYSGEQGRSSYYVLGRWKPPGKPNAFGQPELYAELLASAIHEEVRRANPSSAGHPTSVALLGPDKYEAAAATVISSGLAPWHSKSVKSVTHLSALVLEVSVSKGAVAPPPPLPSFGVFSD